MNRAQETEADDVLAQQAPGVDEGHEYPVGVRGAHGRPSALGLAAPVSQDTLMRKLARRRAAHDEGEGATLQRKAGNRPEVPSTSESGIAERGFSGERSPLPFQSEMEAKFGRSFGQIEAYTGPEAAAASEALGAEAYTVGNKVAFRSDAPSREVVAHELAHTIQQSGGSAVRTFASNDPDELEQEADAAAETVVAGDQAEIALTAGGGGEVRKWAGSDHYAIGNLGGHKALAAFKDQFGDVEGGPQSQKARVVHGTSNPSAVRSGMQDTLAIATGRETAITMGEASRFSGDYAADVSGVSGRDREGGSKKSWNPFEWGRSHEQAAMIMTAATNSNHFYPINGMEWANHHSIAVALAAAGDMPGAMRHEGFAAHFLQDTFSSGHFAPRSLDSIPHLEGKIEFLPHDIVNGLMRSKQWHDFFCMVPNGLPTNRGRFHGDSYMDGNDLEMVSNAVRDSMLEVLAAGQGKPIDLGVAAQIPKPDLPAILADPVVGPVWRLMQDSYRSDFHEARQDVKASDRGKTDGGTDYSSKQVLDLIAENIMGEGTKKAPGTPAEAVNQARVDTGGALTSIHHYVTATWEMQRLLWQDSELEQGPKEMGPHYKLQELESKFHFFSAAARQADKLAAALEDYLAREQGPGRQQAERMVAAVAELRRHIERWRALVADAGSLFTFRKSTIEKYREQIELESREGLRILGTFGDLPPVADRSDPANTTRL